MYAPKDRQLDLPEQVIDLEASYQATIATENGDIVIELFADTAPTNVNSFAYLAQNGWYDDVTFHRVLDGFMAQAGDPSGSGFGWPGYRCPDEIVSSRGFADAGVVAMANSGANTNGGHATPWCCMTCRRTGQWPACLPKSSVMLAAQSRRSP